VCSGQQESGSACVASRGNYGAVSIRDWLPVGVDEVRLRGAGPAERGHRLRGRNVSRFDRRTGQVSIVGPVGGAWRRWRSSHAGAGPLGPHDAGSLLRVDKVSLFFANNYLWKTMDAARTGRGFSPTSRGRHGRRRRASASTLTTRPRSPSSGRHLHDRPVVPGHAGASGPAPTTAHPRHR